MFVKKPREAWEKLWRNGKKENKKKKRKGKNKNP
jgi:hypothetical protein